MNVTDDEVLAYVKRREYLKGVIDGLWTARFIVGDLSANVTPDEVLRAIERVIKTRQQQLDTPRTVDTVPWKHTRKGP